MQLDTVWGSVVGSVVEGSASRRLELENRLLDDDEVPPADLVLCLVEVYDGLRKLSAPLRLLALLLSQHLMRP
jgi:hypothetical protein